MVLNLWSWRDAEDTPHVGVSEGPFLDRVLDLRMVNPGLDSVAAVWAYEPNITALRQILETWLTGVHERVTLRPESLTVPVPLVECWAAGVTYEMSRDARLEETHGAEQFYRMVYEAERPELFFKAPGPRVRGPEDYVGLRRDSQWQIPEPELTVILDPNGEAFGFTVGNDMSSRDIEGENPLYLPQAKIYHNSAAIGPSVVLAGTWDPSAQHITMAIRRASQIVFQGGVSTALMRRTPELLVRYLRRDWPIEGWTALMTGTTIVPPSDFSLEEDDAIMIDITGIGRLVNYARRIGPSWASVPNI